MRRVILLAILVASAAGACAPGNDVPTTGTGGTGGSVTTGGAPGSGGASLPGSGGMTTPGSGGSASGGSASGGSASGGSASGGAASGGAATGGSANGSGGAPATGGRAATGGRGGAATGGAPATGGAGGSAPGTGGAGGRTDQGSLPAVTLFLAGDSTVMAYGASSAQQGWGEHLAEFLITKVTINNQSLGGLSIHTFMYSDDAETQESGRWTTIKNGLKAGDYLMIDFGINDSGTVAGRSVTVADYSRLLGVMIDFTLGKKATPILVTPSALQEKSGTTFTNNRLGPYAMAMRTVAAAKGILVDDLNARSLANLNSVGQTGADKIYYMGDKAHFTLYGGTLMAQFVIEELTRIGSPLAAYRKP